MSPALRSIATASGTVLPHRLSPLMASIRSPTLNVPVLEAIAMSSCDYHVTIMWVSCGYHVTIMWVSCDYHVGIMWVS